MAAKEEVRRALRDQGVCSALSKPTDSFRTNRGLQVLHKAIVTKRLAGNQSPMLGLLTAPPMHLNSSLCA